MKNNELRSLIGRGNYQRSSGKKNVLAVQFGLEDFKSSVLKKYNFAQVEQFKWKQNDRKIWRKASF